MNDSEIVIHKHGGMTLAGRDATMLFAAITLRSALRLYARKRMKVSRAYTPSAMLASTSTYTGKTYKRGAFEAAAADLDTWIATMKAAMPVTDNRMKVDCRNCGGDGYSAEGGNCPACKGSGKTTTGL